MSCHITWCVGRSHDQSMHAHNYGIQDKDSRVRIASNPGSLSGGGEREPGTLSAHAQNLRSNF